MAQISAEYISGLKIGRYERQFVQRGDLLPDSDSAQMALENGRLLAVELPF